MAAQRQWLDELRPALDLMKQGQPQKCIEALEALVARYPGDDLCRALALDGMGRANFALQRPDAAVQALQESLALLRATMGPTAPMTLGAMQNLAHALLGLEKVEESLDLGREALRLTIEACGADSPQVAEAQLRLSSAYYRKRDFDRAESLMLSAKEIWEKQGFCVPQLGVCLNNLGRICEERGQLAEGIALHRQAVALRRELLGEHEETAFSLGNLGVALACAGQWDEAAATLQDSVSMYDRLGLGMGAEAQGYKKNLEICHQARAAAAPTA